MTLPAGRSEHTPTPIDGWTLQGDGQGIAYFNPRIEAGEDIYDERHDSSIARFNITFDDDETEANAMFCFKAVKAHDALVAALDACVVALDANDAVMLHDRGRGVWSVRTRNAVDAARAALKLAEGGE